MLARWHEGVAIAGDGLFQKGGQIEVDVLEGNDAIGCWLNI